MSKRLLALNLLFAAAAVAFSIQLVRILSTPRLFPPPIAAPAPVRAAGAPKEEPSPPRPPLGAYGVVATKNLFNSSRSETGAQTAVATAAKPVLHGVVINGRTRLAYLEDPTTKRVYGYKVGDPVAGGRLEQIEGDRVVIKRAEGPFEVKLKDPSKPKPVTRALAPPPGAAPRPGVPGAPSIIPPTPGVQPPVPPVGPRAPALLRRSQGAGEAPGAPAPAR